MLRHLVRERVRLFQPSRTLVGVLAAIPRTVASLATSDRSPMRPVIKTLLAVLCFSLVGLGGCHKKNFAWTEEVQLSDGSHVQVERTIRYGKMLSELGGPTSAWISEANVTIVEQGRQLPVWSHPMKPFILDRDAAKGRWIIVANARDYCEYASRLGTPVPTFPAFELIDGQWIYVGLPATFIGRKANMLLGVPRADQEAHLSAQQVVDTNERRFPALEWRSIDPSKIGLCDEDISSSLSTH